MTHTLLLLPTSVGGSHALPSSAFLVRAAREANRPGLTGGLLETPWWVAVAKFRAMVEATGLLRRELGATV